MRYYSTVMASQNSVALPNTYKKSTEFSDETQSDMLQLIYGDLIQQCIQTLRQQDIHPVCTTLHFNIVPAK